MANTYTLITSSVLATASSTVNLTSIPQTYNDLVLKINARSTSDGGNYVTVVTRFNSDSNTNYSGTNFYSNGASSSSTSTGNNQTDFQTFATVNGSASTANTFGLTELYISNYTSSGTKLIFVRGTTEKNGINANDAFLTVVGGQYRGTSGISSINISFPTYAIGSSFYLYGIKNS
jgi:hypothetical protein